MWNEIEDMTCSEHESLYQALQIGILASEDEIKQAYRRAALKFHPDRHPSDPCATERFQLIQHAYEVLRDSASRADYDKELLHRLYLEEYLRRFADLILTSSGLELPLEKPYEAHAPCLPVTLWQLSY